MLLTILAAMLKMKEMRQYLVLVVIGIGLLLSACGGKRSEALVIATAANMQFAMEALVEAFTAETGIGCQAIISSSGKLTAQIKEGAPFDVFVSADMKYPAELFEAGFTLQQPKIYAYGQLVLWTHKGTSQPKIQDLPQATIRHIALANPKTAPYGRAAMEVLTHYNLLEEVEDKLVYGESIAQTNQFILSEAAEVGFTAQSVVRSPRMKEEGQWITIPQDIYRPIAQGIVLLQGDRLHPGAQAFYDFIWSAEARRILEAYGYQVVD